MAHIGTPKFSNDVGAERIQIGVKKFECIGAKSPFDHPHVNLDMGEDDHIVCPYCSTLYKYDGQLNEEQSRPAGCCVSKATANA